MPTIEDRDPFSFARLGECDTELFALIADYRSVDRARKELWQELQRRENELPPRRAAKVEIGRMILWDGTQEPLYAEDEEHLKRCCGMRDTAMAATLRNPRAKEWKHTEIYRDRLEKLITELHVQILAADAAYEQAREAAGIIILSHQATELSDQGKAIRDKIEAIRPTTIAGVIALIDFWRERDFQGWPEQAIAGLREIAAREPQW
jgi:hypothetical protein